MPRRIVVFLVLCAGMIPAAYALRQFPEGRRHALLILGVIAIGVVLNGIVLLAHRMTVRPALRNLAAIVMSLIGLSLAAGAWQHRQIALEPPSPMMAQAGGDDAHSRNLRAVSRQLARNLAWTAAAVAYMVLSILLLPGRQSPPDAPTPPPDLFRRT
jgi:hypothetical protein